MVNVDRVLLVAVLGLGAVSSATLYSLNNRIESLESRLATPEMISAVTRVQDKAAVEQLAALTAVPRGQPQLAAARKPTPIAAPISAPTAAEPPSKPPLGSVDEMIGRLEARMKQNPKDAEGWRMLGWSYFQTGHYSESASAYAKAVDLNPNAAAFKSARGEALVKAADGAVTSEAKQLFDGALQLDPKDPKARFFDGLVKERAGDKTSALDEWISIANEVGSNSPLVPDLMQQISALSRDMGVDVSSRVQLPQPAVSGGAAGSSNVEQDQKPAGEADRTKADTTAAAGATVPTEQSDQMTMIRGMVERLASRLDQSPRDADGWIRLIRSQKVLGEVDKARQSRDRALKIFDDSPPDQARIAAEARELGLEQ